MQVRFSNKFKKEISAINDEKLAKAVFMAIENVKICMSIHRINGIKKLKGH